MKICIICKKLKELEKFKPGRNQCLDCLKEKNYQYRLKNKERASEYNKEYRMKNKERIKILQHEKYLSKQDYYKERIKRYYGKNRDEILKKSKIYRNKNIEKKRLQDKLWREKNKEKKKIIDQRWREENKDRLNYIQKIYRKRRAEENPTIKLHNRISCLIRLSLRSGKNGISWPNLVGYNIDKLKKHLEGQFLPGMTWKNYGRRGWHIDHIIPVSVFNFNSYNDIDFQKCWSLKNLRPMWEGDNIRKGKKLFNDFQPSFSFTRRTEIDSPV